MTQQEKREWIATVLPVMKQHLIDKLGYPNCTREQIMGEVRSMWELLQSQGLLKEGMNYSEFYFHAQEQARAAAFREHIRAMGIQI